ncbi:MAG: glycosyltransferase, partial [Planctomycetota bacterium]
SPQVESGSNDSVFTQRVLWLFNSIGTKTSLLYWGRILPRFMERFPDTEVCAAMPPSKPIPETDKHVECVGAIHIPLGPRKNSYQRQYVVASPFIIGRIRQSNPDVVVVKELVAFAMYLALLRPLLGKTKILALIEGNPYQGRTRKPNALVLWLRKMACRRFDLIMTNNDGGKEYLMKSLGVPESKIYVRPFLVSDVSPPAAGDSLELPEGIVKPDNKVVFLYTGQLIPRKGVKQVVEAVSRLGTEERAQFELWMVGDGKQRDELDELIRDKQLESTVKLLGRQPYEKMSAFYCAADVFVMPTLDDYRALVGFEAISHGLPMMHSIHDGSNLEVVDAAVNGYTFDPQDADATAERLRWFLANQDQLPEMSAASTRLSHDFTVEKAVEGLTHAIFRCLGYTTSSL